MPTSSFESNSSAKYNDLVENFRENINLFVF